MSRSDLLAGFLAVEDLARAPIAAVVVSAGVPVASCLLLVSPVSVQIEGVTRCLFENLDIDQN